MPGHGWFQQIEESAMYLMKPFVGVLLAAALGMMPAPAQSSDSERRAEGARAAERIERLDRNRFGPVAQLMRNPNRINTALYRSDPSLVGRTMLAAKFAESERIAHQGVIRTTLMMDFMHDLLAAMPGMSEQMMQRMGVNQYELTWPLQVRIDGKPDLLLARIPVHPEEILKIQRKHAGISDLQYAAMLHGMGTASVMLAGMGAGVPMKGASVNCDPYLSGDVSMDYLLVNPSALLVAQGCMLVAQAQEVRTTQKRIDARLEEDEESERRGLALIGQMQVVSATPREVTFAAPRAVLQAMSASSGQADGQQLVLHALRVSYDPVTLKELGMQMDGVLTDEAGARNISIETRYSDFRPVEGTPLYEPFRQTFRAQGMLSEQERREMASQLPELEKQVASMPASQRQMVPALEKQVDMMRSIANGGPLKMSMLTSSVALNPDIAADGCGMAGGAFVGGLSDLFGGAACKDGGMLGALSGMFKGNAGGPAAQGGGGGSHTVAGETQQQCLERLAASREGVVKKKRGLGGLVNAANRIAGRFGVGQGVAEKLGDAYTVSEAGGDLAAAARDLGLTSEEAEVCFNR